LEEKGILKIVVLGPDGAGKSSVIHGLLDKFALDGCDVKMRHLKPFLFIPKRGEPGAIVNDPHGRPPRSALLSIAKILVWLLEEWYVNCFQDRNETLFIYDRYYHDLLIDPKRYRYGGPQWIAIIVGKLIPQPRLWVLLDAPAQVLQARKQEVPLKETARQRQAYLAFVRDQNSYRIIDASQLLDKMIADTEHAIIDAMSGGKCNRG
jgi:thymidylate kinase